MRGKHQDGSGQRLGDIEGFELPRLVIRRQLMPLLSPAGSNRRPGSHAFEAVPVIRAAAGKVILRVASGQYMPGFRMD
ncbi:hypothetical protein D3C73_1477540 [compost metagenome]